MNINEATDAINNLKEIASIEQFSFSNNESIKYFPKSRQPIAFRGRNNYLKFHETIDQLIQYHNLNNEITNKTFEDAIAYLLGELFIENRLCSKDDLLNLYTSFLNIEKQNYECFCPIYGISTESDLYSLGDFKIYKIDYFKNELCKKYKSKNLINNIYDDFFDSNDSNYIIEIKVIAREHDKAKENADVLFRIFENVLKYVVGDTAHYREPRVFSFKQNWSRSTVSCSKTDANFKIEAFDVTFNVNLENENYTTNSLGNDKLWYLITKQKKTEIENRLLNSVEWIGKATYEKDYSQAITQFVFALEGLLQLNNKDFITSSIISQISEWLAFIIADKYEERIKIIKSFKEIYRKRSAVAHGASNNVDKSDVIKASQLCRYLIICLLTVEEINNIKTINALAEWVNKQKFT